MVGAAIAAHPDVDMVSFTGSTATGAPITKLAADRIARVALELGGKSANVILEDADLAKAVKVGVGNAFLNSGQTCTAWTRMLVHRSRYEEALDASPPRPPAATARRPVRRGHPARPAGLGRAARARARLHRQRLADGARLVAGGLDAPVPDRGYFVAPTVLADVDPDATVAQEEIFGPVLVVIPFDRRRRGGRDRQQLPVRPGRRRLVGRPGAGAGGGPADAHRRGRHQRRRVQPARPVRRLQAVRHRPRARRVRAG